MSDDLKLAVENLSLQDKVELWEYLSDMINSSRSVSQSPLRCSILMGEMAKVMGKETIGYLSREADEVWARTMVAFQMCKEGYSITEVGRQMMKDHSTIIHLRNKMQDVFALPQLYGDILEIWNRFQKRIQDDIHKGTTENPVSLGGEFPDGSQGEMGEESGEDCPPGDLGNLHQGDRGQEEI